jgi:hypothetical protein
MRGDVDKSGKILGLGAVRISVEQALLCKMDAGDAIEAAKKRMDAKEALASEEEMRLVVAPLMKTSEDRRELVKTCVELAARIDDGQRRAFVLAGLLVASDNFIDKAYAEYVRGLLTMTKIGMLYEDELNAVIKEKEAMRLAKEAAEKETEAVKIAKEAVEKKAEAIEKAKELVEEKLAKARELLAAAGIQDMAL